MSTAADQPYPPEIPDRLPDAPATPPTQAAPAERVTPQRKLCVVDYHLQGPTVRVPSREADAFAGHLHGWLYRLQGEDPDERPQIDPEQHLAPFAAWLLGDGHREPDPRTRPGLSVRVCWYSEDAAHRSIASLARNPTALIGSQPYALSGISPVSRQPITAASLLERRENAREVRISTISPVAFVNHERWHVSVEASTVLGSTLHRWMKIWPGTLPAQYEHAMESATNRALALAWWGRISTSMCSVESRVYTRGRATLSGMRGWWEYSLQDLESGGRRHLVMGLLRGAEIFGLGARPAYGFGAVRVEVVR